MGPSHPGAQFKSEVEDGQRCCFAEQALNLSRTKITAGGQESAGSGYGDCGGGEGDDHKNESFS